MKLPDYDDYEMTSREMLVTAAKVLCILAVTAYICYDSLFFTIILLPYALFYFRKQKELKKEARKWKLNLQFGDAIKSLSAALEAGYSVENGFAQAYRDLLLSYAEDEPIMVELRAMLGQIRNSMTAEEAVRGFAARSGLDDVSGFADVFSTARRTGGNIIAIIRSSTEMIMMRVDLKRQIRTATAAAKYEADIMKLVPFGVIVYLRMFAPEMIMSLYGNLRGIIFMTGVLIAYAALGELSERMVRIEL